MNRKTVGILGGMGPHSTVRLFERIVDKTPAEREQDHLRILIDNRPQIPDRTAFILGEGPSPIPMLQESAQLLERWGAELIAIPCNTAHFFWEHIQAVVQIPVLNMIELVAKTVSEVAGGRVLLLATTGTVRSGLYQRYLPADQLILPDEEIQQSVMNIIYGPEGVKQRGPLPMHEAQLEMIIQKFNSEQPAAVIAGCTEIELALGETASGLPVIKPLEVLAKEVVSRALSP